MDNNEQFTSQTSDENIQDAIESTEKPRLSQGEPGKIAQEVGYAVAGFASFVGEKAKAFFDDQKQQYVAAHPDETEPGAKEFLAQLNDRLNKFVDDIAKGYRDMTDRGRETVKNGPKSWTSKPADTDSPDTTTAPATEPMTADEAWENAEIKNDEA